MVVSWCGYLSLRTGIKPASSFQVCPPRNHGAGWSPGLLCVPETYPALPLRVPQEPGRQRDFLETGAQAKLGTEEAQSQAWSREGGVDSRPGERRLLSTHTPSSTSWLLSRRVSEQRCSVHGLRGCQSAGNPTLGPRGGGEGPLAMGTSLYIALPKDKSSNPGLRK